MHKWCFSCKNFKKNSHGMNVDPELWVRQARSPMPPSRDEDCWRMKGDTIVGDCEKDNGNGVMLCAAVIDDCPGWADRLAEAARGGMKATVQAYEGMGTELLLHGRTEKALRLGEAYDKARELIGLQDTEKAIVRALSKEARNED